MPPRPIILSQPLRCMWMTCRAKKCLGVAQVRLDENSLVVGRSSAFSQLRPKADPIGSIANDGYTASPRNLYPPFPPLARPCASRRRNNPLTSISLRWPSSITLRWRGESGGAKEQGMSNLEVREGHGILLEGRDDRDGAMHCSPGVN